MDLIQETAHFFLFSSFSFWTTLGGIRGSVPRTVPGTAVGNHRVQGRELEVLIFKVCLPVM